MNIDFISCEQNMSPSSATYVDYEMMNNVSSSAFENSDSDEKFLFRQHSQSENIFGHDLIRKYSIRKY